MVVQLTYETETVIKQNHIFRIFANPLGLDFLFQFSQWLTITFIIYCLTFRCKINLKPLGFSMPHHSSIIFPGEATFFNLWDAGGFHIKLCCLLSDSKWWIYVTSTVTVHVRNIIHVLSHLLNVSNAFSKWFCLCGSYNSHGKQQTLHFRKFNVFFILKW